jgi:hypothetical protein
VQRARSRQQLHEGVRLTGTSQHSADAHARCMLGPVAQPGSGVSSGPAFTGIYLKAGSLVLLLQPPQLAATLPAEPRLYQAIRRWWRRACELFGQAGHLSAGRLYVRVKEPKATCSEELMHRLPLTHLPGSVAIDRFTAACALQWAWSAMGCSSILLTEIYTNVMFCTLHARRTRHSSTALTADYTSTCTAGTAHPQHAQQQHSTLQTDHKATRRPHPGAQV